MQHYVILNSAYYSSKTVTINNKGEILEHKIIEEIKTIVLGYCLTRAKLFRTVFLLIKSSSTDLNSRKRFSFFFFFQVKRAVEK